MVCPDAAGRGDSGERWRRGGKFAVDAIPADLPETERDKRLDVVLREVAHRPALEQTRLLKAIQARFGKDDLTLTVLREHVKNVGRQAKEEASRSSREELIRLQRGPAAPPLDSDLF